MILVLIAGILLLMVASVIAGWLAHERAAR